jgi:hypothetical protein
VLPFAAVFAQSIAVKPALTVDPKTAKSAIEILAKWRFSAPRGGQKGGCRMTRLADFELNFEDEMRKKARWNPSGYKNRMVECRAIFGIPAISQ